ncbi:hypothetical protein ACHAWF_008736, partial [Thalassiosira exigua]
TNLVTFLEDNPREVLILEFDMQEGSTDDLHVALQYSGLVDRVYRPDSQYYIEEWPTLGELIDSNKRVLLFGSGDGKKSCPAIDCRDGMLYANDHFVSTLTDGSDLDGCRPSIAGDVNVGYFVVNNYEERRLALPSPKRARELNSYEALEARFEECEGRRSPSLLAVEFWDEGDTLEFAQNVNGGKHREGGEFLAAIDPEEVKEEEGAGAGEDGARGLRARARESSAGRRRIRA